MTKKIRLGARQPRPRVKGGLSQRPEGKQQEDDTTPISSKKLRAAEPPVHRSVNAGYEGEFVFPLPNSIRGARDDRCWWEAFGEGARGCDCE